MLGSKTSKCYIFPKITEISYFTWINKHQIENVKMPSYHVIDNKKRKYTKSDGAYRKKQVSFRLTDEYYLWLMSGYHFKRLRNLARFSNVRSPSKKAHINAIFRGFWSEKLKLSHSIYKHISHCLQSKVAHKKGICTPKLLACSV